VLLWFAGMSVVGVVTVFQSPGIDYRFVMAGAMLPVAEGLLGHPWVLNTLLGAVAVLGLTILATRRHRLLRRRLLGLPIGLFAHLVLDGVWTRSHVFWWPFFGWSFGRTQVPELSRGTFGIVLELAGIVALGWCWRRFGLGDAGRRRRFLTSGRLEG
jgi:hypothetical protein